MKDKRHVEKLLWDHLPWIAKSLYSSALFCADYSMSRSVSYYTCCFWFTRFDVNAFILTLGSLASLCWSKAAGWCYQALLCLLAVWDSQNPESEMWSNLASELWRVETIMIIFTSALVLYFHHLAFRRFWIRAESVLASCFKISAS